MLCLCVNVSAMSCRHRVQCVQCCMPYSNKINNNKICSGETTRISFLAWRRYFDAFGTQFIMSELSVWRKWFAERNASRLACKTFAAPLPRRADCGELIDERNNVNLLFKRNNHVPLFTGLKNNNAMRMLCVCVCVVLEVSASNRSASLSPYQSLPCSN